MSDEGLKQAQDASSSVVDSVKFKKESKSKKIKDRALSYSGIPRWNESEKRVEFPGRSKSAHKRKKSAVKKRKRAIAKMSRKRNRK